MNTKLNTIKLLFALALLVFGLNANAQLQTQIHVHSDGGDNPNGLKSTIGHQNIAEGNYSLAAGWGNQSKGQTSFAIGYYNLAEGLNTIAMGMYTKSQSAHSITIGNGYSFAKPLLNNTEGMMLGMGSNLPTLFISPCSENRTGKVAIGNCTVPQSKLHIKADNDEDAAITLEPVQNKDASIMFRNKECFIKVEKSGKMSITVPSKPIVFSASKYCFGTERIYMKNEGTDDFSVFVPKTMSMEALQIRFSGNEAIDMNSQRITMNGKVGINMENTSEDLDVAIANGVYAPNGFTLNSGNGTERKPIMLEGCVNINTGIPYTDEWFSLAVKGGILAEQVLIKSERSWPDFVFASDYELMPLSELKSYIQTNRHLPDVPSESQVSEQGVEVGEMQSVLLKKIEELTLYTIQLQEQVEQLRQKVNEIETK